mmetsp:Transcript_26835/g.46596  ORF Transcript_26835/g.46596 Transcript_26835/m.46596 type:complete len:144 (-) Transcript_26835:472-903(-)
MIGLNSTATGGFAACGGRDEEGGGAAASRLHAFGGRALRADSSRALAGGVVTEAKLFDRALASGDEMGTDLSERALPRLGVAVEASADRALPVESLLPMPTCLPEAFIGVPHLGVCLRSGVAKPAGGRSRCGFAADSDAPTTA